MISDKEAGQGREADRLVGADDVRRVVGQLHLLEPRVLDGLIFLTLAEAHDRLRPSQRRRLRAADEALAMKEPRYMEFGRAT